MAWMRVKWDVSVLVIDFSHFWMSLRSVSHITNQPNSNCDLAASEKGLSLSLLRTWSRRLHESQQTLGPTYMLYPLTHVINPLNLGTSLPNSPDIPRPPQFAARNHIPYYPHVPNTSPSRHCFHQTNTVGPNQPDVVLHRMIESGLAKPTSDHESL